MDDFFCFDVELKLQVINQDCIVQQLWLQTTKHLIAWLAVVHLIRFHAVAISIVVQSNDEIIPNDLKIWVK